MSPSFDLRSLLDRVEAAAPNDAVAAVADQPTTLSGAAARCGTDASSGGASSEHASP